MTGRVKYFKKSYGFITPDDPTIDDVFVHHTEIEPQRKGFKTLEEGDVVKFDLHKQSRGFQAKNVEVKREPVALSQFKTEGPDNFGNRRE